MARTETASLDDLPADWARPRAVAARWSKRQLEVFDVLEPVAVVGVGMPEPLVRIEVETASGRRASYAGNSGIWPIRIGITESRKDTVTPRYNVSPFPLLAERGLFWVWLPSRQHAIRVRDAALPVIETDTARTYLRDAVDAGTEQDIAGLVGIVRATARRLGVVSWDEEDLADFCFDVGKQAGDGRISARLVDGEMERWSLLDRMR